jgi:uncharacterized membrane protein
VIVMAVSGALTLAAMTATAGFLLGRYDLLPRSIPVHFRGGRPDRFLLKTYAMVFTPLWTQVILAVVIGGVALLLLWRAHGVDARAEHAAQDRHRMLHGAEAVALLGLVWISFQFVNAWSLTELWLRWTGGMGLAYEVALITAGVLSVLIGGRAMLKIGRPAARHAADGSVWRLKALYFGRPIAIAIMLAILLVGLGGPFILARSLLR